MEDLERRRVRGAARHATRYRADEQRLIARARQGDHGAFAALTRPYLRTVHRVCRRVLGEPMLAEDASQAALLAAWRSLDRFDGRARFCTWLCQIAHNAALAELRRRRLQLAGAPSELGAPAARGHEDAVVARLDLQAALRTLAPQTRAAVVLREFAGLSYAEIAAAERTGLNNVKTRIHRGRAQLACALTAA
jgi:RNA polymerase sigma factor (sigma-70 family)